MAIGTSGLRICAAPRRLLPMRRPCLHHAGRLPVYPGVECRSHRLSVFAVNLFSNRWLLAGILSAVLLQLLVLYLPAARTIFHTVPLTLADWVRILLVSGAILIADEMWKLVQRQGGRRGVRWELPAWLPNNRASGCCPGKWPPKSAPDRHGCCRQVRGNLVRERQARPVQARSLTGRGYAGLLGPESAPSAPSPVRPARSCRRCWRRNTAPSSTGSSGRAYSPARRAPPRTARAPHAGSRNTSVCALDQPLARCRERIWF